MMKLLVLSLFFFMGFNHLHPNEGAEYYTLVSFCLLVLAIFAYAPIAAALWLPRYIIRFVAHEAKEGTVS